LVPLAVGCSSKSEAELLRERHADAISRACRYLWAQQGMDGGWHSEEYGLMRSGQSLTPFVLWTLLQVPDAVAVRNGRKSKKAARFLKRHLHKSGALGLSEAMLSDYPNYATGLGMLALRELGGRDDIVRKMRSYLLGQQFQKALGYKPKDPAFGGWGMGGEPRQAPDPGHMDLSMTRLVLEGLAALPPEKPDAFVRAQRFLARCQNADGGFYFSPVELGANKGGREGDGFKSYGSTTADGILALLATGLPPDNKDVQRAGAWLVTHHRVDQVPGIPADNPSSWHLGLRFYYLAVSAQALQKLGIGQAPAERNWREDLVNTLVATQRRDGSWVNPVDTQKENDPLIATGLAVQALAAAWRP
jgi:hypothetical protein